MTTINRYSFWKRFRNHAGVIFVGISLLLFGVHDMAAGQSNTNVEDNSLLVQVLSDQYESNKNLMSITFTNVNLEEALEILAERLRVGFSYNPDIMPEKRVNFRMTNVPAHEIIYKLLEGTNLEPVLPPSKDVIILKEKGTEIDFDILQDTVRGTVVDAQTGEMLPGVNVLVQGTSTGTATDLDGRFELNVNSLNETLIFSYIGYVVQEVSIDGRQTIDIQLESQAIAGDELVVIGYGVQRRSDVTGSVTSVQVEDIAYKSTPSLEGVLQGQASGVFVRQSGGKLDGDFEVTVRGIGSVTGDTQPLYVVDDVPLFSGDLSTINQNDIESIEILKDASATAIFGARGANGVVLITTKSGIPGTTNLTFSSNIGFERITKTLDQLSTEQQRKLGSTGNFVAN